MIDGSEAGRKRVAVTALALFVGLLFGYSPAAQAKPDSRTQLGSPDYVKRVAPLRTSLRTQADDAEPEAGLAPPTPTIVTERLSTRPATASCSVGWSPGPRTSLTAYRARAPPAS